MASDLGYIYRIENKLNGKKYIGLTRKSIEERWGQHVRVANRYNKTYLHRAITKYGAGNFEIMWYASTWDMAYLGELERLIIIDVEPEYNQTNGGEVTLGRKYSDAVRDIIRTKNTGKKRSAAHCAKMSIIKREQLRNDPELLAKARAALAKGRANPNNAKNRIIAAANSARGRVWSMEARRKLSAACMGRVYGKDIIDKMRESKRMGVRCIEVGEIYKCAQDAADKLGICKTSISKVCKGTRKTAGGLHFEYIKVVI